MNRKRQKTRTCSRTYKGEALRDEWTGPELFDASEITKSQESTSRIMEEVCEPGNLLKALRKVRRNQGSPGIDGMTVKEMPGYLQKNWREIRRELLEGTYKPQAIKRVEIPKPGGGKRELGIPTVIDRLIQQAMQEVLQEKWDKEFSRNSYGFRPGRSAQGAIKEAGRNITNGYGYVVDIDLEKFFDRVNHDKLMSIVGKRIRDKRVMKLIGQYLRVGAVMGEGVVVRRSEGTPQGSPLSPLLSNLYLDELDKELERRGHRFVRYADDCNIYVKSERSGHRVKESVTRWIEKKLKLKVNVAKSAVDRATRRKFLGYQYYRTKFRTLRLGISASSLKEFKRRIRRMTYRTRREEIGIIIKDLNRYLKGWSGYYGICCSMILRQMEGWVRRRLRAILWKQWRTCRRRRKELLKLGLSYATAVKCAGSSLGPWRMSRSQATNKAMTVAYFEKLGFQSMIAR